MKSRIFLGDVLSVVIILAVVFGVTAQKTTIRSGRVSSANSGARDWLQWGGPQRDFITPVTGLASTWPAEGPKKLWSRPLGDGYSGIAVEGETLYTGYR